MKRIISVFICVSIFISATFSGIPEFTFAETSSAIQGEFVEGQAIVKFKDEISTSQSGLKISSIDDSIDYTVEKTWNFNSNSFSELSTQDINSTNKEKKLTMALVKSDSLSTSQLISKLEKQENVQYVEPNYIYNLRTSDQPLTNDPLLYRQWGLDTIGVESIWSQGVIGSDDIVVAVLDTGVEYNHEDLRDNMWVKPKSLIDLPGNEHGCNFLYDPFYSDLGYTNSDPLDDRGHGTFCAGILGAVGNNAKGITGVNQKIKIMAIKIIDKEGKVRGAALYDAYQYLCKVKDSGVNLVAVNMSWGGIGEDNKIDIDFINALGERGVLSICAAGNDGLNTDISTNHHTPSGIKSPYKISVTSIDEDKTIPNTTWYFENKTEFFANYGRTSVDVAAPGFFIYSTENSNNYEEENGTSFATPFITGSVALLKAYSDEKKLGWSMDEIRARILGGTMKNESLKDKTLSDGYFNLGIAIDDTKIMPVLNYSSCDSTNETITIEGYFFGNSKGKLKANNKELKVINWSDNKITAKLPGNITSGETFNFTVINSDNIRSGRNDFEVTINTEVGENGFVKEGADNNGFDAWYYYENGVKASGWREIDGYIYYFNPDNNNIMQTGWLKTDTGDYYYFDANIYRTSTRLSSPYEGLGRMHTGWANDGGKEWYYLDAKSKSFSDGRGKMVSGWFTDGGSDWYYCNSDKSHQFYGMIETGWEFINGQWYYLCESEDNNMKNYGKILRGWQLINNYWYYFYNNGVMAANTYINGYYVDVNGRCT